MKPLREETSASLAASPEDLRKAAAAVVVLTLLFAATVPFAKVPLAPVPAFIPTYQAALVVGDLVTAALLLGQLQFFRSKALLILAGGYLFTAIMAITHALTFPGLFAPTGLLGAGPQSTAWLYMFWHLGFPLCVIGYARSTGEFSGRAPVMRCIAVAMGAAALLTAIGTVGHPLLPSIMSGNRYTPLMIAVVGTVWGASVFALYVLWRRRPHTVLDAWLLVVMCAWVFDIALAAVLNGGRYDTGFYAGRLYGLLAATLVMFMLLIENARLYRGLRDRNRELVQARQAALDAERAKGAFLATMSHEIRTPMSGVMGMLELLQLTRLDGEQRTTLEIVRESGRSLLRIVDDILDFSQIEAGRLDLHPEPTSIAALLARTQAIYAGNARSKGLALHHFVDERISPAVMVDPLRLGQILNNLTSNAIKFTASGSVTLRADLVKNQDEVDLVRFSVEDTGPGIAPEDVARLFEPFTQASRPRTPGSSGLGLSICRRLASLMNGLLEVSSEVGKGTRMTLTIPLGVTTLAPATETSTPAPAASVGPDVAPTVDEARRHGRLILVVDDHPINRMVLIKQLNSLGHAAETANNGLEAIDRWTRGGFAAIITDCNMPEMNGYELARHIRACEARDGVVRIPIIACTANALDGESVECLMAGMDDCLTKPVSLAELRAKLEQWLPRAEPIDREALRELSDGNRATERELLAQFWRYNEDDAHALREAVAADAFDGIVRAAHRIRGASRSVGASGLADVCERIEQAARATDRAALQSNMIPFERELQRLRAHLEANQED